MNALTPWGRPDLRGQAAHRGLVRQAGAEARFATHSEMHAARWRYVRGEPTILLGHYQGQPVGLREDDRGMFTCAGSRCGKGVSLIVPNIVLWPGSIIANDPKGELTRKTARARRELHNQDVYIIDPDGVSGCPSDSYNVIGDVSLTDPRLGADLALIGESLFTASGGVSNANHWQGSSSKLFSTVTLFVLCYFENPTLLTVHEVLSGAHGTIAGSLEAPSEVMGAMLESDALNGLLKRRATEWLEIPSREQGSILSTTRTQLEWLDGMNQADPPMARALGSSDLSLRDLKRKRITIYLCLPASDLHARRGFLRTFFNLAMARLELTRAPAGAPPVLVLLDEFPTLGHMASLEKAAGLLAGSGVKLWPVVQDLGQLQAIYSKSWGTFLGNAGVSTFHGIGGDEATAEYVSKRLGVTQYQEEQKPSGSFTQLATTGLLRGSGQWVTAPLLYPHEVERAFARETGRLLAFSPGAPPLALDRYDIRSGFMKEWIDD